MARVRYVGDEPRDVPLLGRSVEPDELVEVDDEVFTPYDWPEAQWSVVEKAKTNQKKSTAKGSA